MGSREEVDPNDESTAESLTSVGTLVGSMPYMSPEQITGGEVDPRSDVFSLGVVIYQMATGQRPFSGSTRAEMMHRIAHVTPEPMTTLDPEIPSELERITFKCLDKRTDGRYQSARELLTDLWPLKRRLDANAAQATEDSGRLQRLGGPGSPPDAATGRGAGADESSTTAFPEASALVARGWAHLRSGSLFELPHAVSAFQGAAAIDPAYAAAHAGLALTKVAQATVRAAPLVEALGEARAAALRALALDDRSADAQVALGQVMFFADWDWTAAERSFQRALAINPNHAEAYLHYGGLVEALGDLERGLQLKLQGLERDSTSALAHVLIAVSFWNQRRYDDVIVWVNKALDRDPQHSFASELLGGAYWQMGDFERAVGEDLKRAAARSPDEQTLAATERMFGEILNVYRRDGMVAATRRILKFRQPAGEPLSEGKPPAERGNADPGLVMLYAMVGDLDAAFPLLQSAIDARDPALVHIAVAPQWDGLRGDPRFNECLARMKLRPVS
jgi:serine/threonine-protein kinase